MEVKRADVVADPGRYVPILKGKTGEFEALKHLSAAACLAVTPLIEVESIPLDWDRPTKTATLSVTLDAHLVRWAKRYFGAWGKKASFIDVDALGDDADAAGTHCVTRLFMEVRSLGGSAVPVVRLTSSAAVVSAIARIHMEDEGGVCIRATDAEVASPAFSGAISGLLQALSISIDSVDLVIDSGKVAGGSEKALAKRWRVAVTFACAVGAWRSITVAASSFPDLAGVKGVKLFPRVEVLAWSLLMQSTLPRTPVFGDFGVQGPDWPDTSSPPFSGNGCVRYTIRTKWLIVRGGQLNKRGTSNAAVFQAIASALVKRKSYRGPAYSWGDAQIAACAKGGKGLASAPKWRAIGANQHITFVTKRIAKTGAP